MKILIVDDKPNLVRVTAMALRTLDCEAFGANNCAAATQLLATERIDAVFLDVNLGAESGMDYLSELTARSTVPVVMFTSHTRDEVAAEAKSRGAFDCLLKPFTVDDLRQLLVRLGQHRQTLSPGPEPKNSP